MVMEIEDFIECGLEITLNLQGTGFQVLPKRWIRLKGFFSSHCDGIEELNIDYERKTKNWLKTMMLCRYDLLRLLKRISLGFQTRFCHEKVDLFMAKVIHGITS